MCEFIIFVFSGFGGTPRLVVAGEQVALEDARKLLCEYRARIVRKRRDGMTNVLALMTKECPKAQFLRLGKGQWVQGN